MRDPDIDKRMLLHALIGQFEVKLMELRAGYAAARDAVLSTPHVMKSKREVFGQESAYLANALQGNIREREAELQTLRGIRLPERPERVVLGCLVGLGTPGEPIETWYFILPVCGGVEVPTPDGTAGARIITPQTPVAKALLGRSLGDEVRLPINPPRDTTVRLLL